MDPDLAAAVHNNAAWCDHVCRTHGIATTWHPDAWVAHSRTPPLYPDAVTLSPDADPEALLARIDDGPGCSIKDSFAALDLAPHGFRILFDARWIHRPAPPAGAAPERRDDVAHLTIEGATVIANRSGAVVGLSNLAPATGPTWLRAVAAIAAAYPGRDLVGYERPEDLPPARAAGFRTTGPLRVWLRDG